MVSLFLVVCFLNRNNTLVEQCSKSKDQLNYLIMKKNIYFREIVYFVAIKSCNKVKKKQLMKFNNTLIKLSKKFIK
jgi:hypothetical protein